MSSNLGGVELKKTAKLTGHIEPPTGPRQPFDGTVEDLREILKRGELAFFGQVQDGSKVFGCLMCRGTVVRYEDDNRKGKPTGGQWQWRTTSNSKTS